MYLAPDLAERFEKELIVLFDGLGGDGANREEQGLERQTAERILCSIVMDSSYCQVAIKVAQPCGLAAVAAGSAGER